MNDDSRVFLVKNMKNFKLFCFIECFILNFLLNNVVFNGFYLIVESKLFNIIIRWDVY